ncbi:hypothetical protein LP415_15715 [Polaromonas sp. P1(28)-8]|nr:hypothetical protein LP415_15715 [Polaromonas sp. P1(28)-8]
MCCRPRRTFIPALYRSRRNPRAGCFRGRVRLHLGRRRDRRGRADCRALRYWAGCACWCRKPAVGPA